MLQRIGVQALVLVTMIGFGHALDNGQAITPPMGFNPWNCFGVGRTGSCKLPLPWEPLPGCHGFNESVIMAQAQVMSEKLASFGWEYISLDCGYSTKRRDAQGNLVVNMTRYPHGMTWLGDQIHSLGLKFGMYAAQGDAQCCSRIDPNATDGSFGYYEKDATLFASWGVDYLKFDGCSGPKSSIAAMSAALNATKRPIAYSINNGVNETNVEYANLWRTTPDIDNTYTSMMYGAMLNNNMSNQIVHGRPGAWNDADMLEVGNFFTDLGDAEGRTNFALWCLMKSPLLLGTDLTNMSAATLDTITNPVAISVSKDRLGEQGILRKSTCYNPSKSQRDLEPCGYQVWSGALSEGGVTAVLANLESTGKQTIALTKDLLPSSRQITAKWNIKDAYSTYKCDSCSLPQSVTVAPHDIAFLVLTPA